MSKPSKRPFWWGKGPRPESGPQSTVLSEASVRNGGNSNGAPVVLSSWPEDKVDKTILSVYSPAKYEKLDKAWLVC